MSQTLFLQSKYWGYSGKQDRQSLCPQGASILVCQYIPVIYFHFWCFGFHFPIFSLSSEFLKAIGSTPFYYLRLLTSPFHLKVYLFLRLWYGHKLLELDDIWVRVTQQWALEMYGFVQSHGTTPVGGAQLTPSLLLSCFHYTASLISYLMLVLVHISFIQQTFMDSNFMPSLVDRRHRRRSFP